MNPGSPVPPEENGSGMVPSAGLSPIRHKVGRSVGRIILWAVGLGLVALLVLYLTWQE